MSEDCLDPHTRAEDILLGALGIGEEAKIVCVERCDGGYRGRAVWPDGEEFDFASDEEPTELEVWALGVLQAEKVTQ